LVALRYRRAIGPRRVGITLHKVNRGIQLKIRDLPFIRVDPHIALSLVSARY
jgi:hypothetical protein